MKTKRIITLLLIALIIFYACTQSKKKEKKDIQLKEFNSQLNSLIPNLNKFSQSLELFKMTEFGFNQQLCINPDNWINYNNDTLKSYMMTGVYSADAMYQLAYGEIENSIKCIVAIKSLIGKVGLSDLSEKYLISPDDPLVNYPDIYVKNIDRFNYIFNVSAGDTKKMHYFLALIIGQYIEKQYLILESYVGTYKNEFTKNKGQISAKLGLILKYQLDILLQIKVLSVLAVKEVGNKDIFIMINDLYNIYSSIDLSSKSLISTGTNDPFPNKNIMDFYKKISQIREYIVSE